MIRLVPIDLVSNSDGNEFLLRGKLNGTCLHRGLSIWLEPVGICSVCFQKNIDDIFCPVQPDMERTHRFFFRNLVKSTRNQIVYTIFRFQVDLTRIKKDFFVSAMKNSSTWHGAEADFCVLTYVAYIIWFIVTYVMVSFALEDGSANAKVLPFL